MKFKTSSDLQVKPLKKKAKRNNIRWDAIFADKISFPFINKLLDEIDTSPCTEII